MNISRTEFTNCKTMKQKEEVEEVEKKMEIEIRRGPWTVEEDMKLISFISLHGEGRWNSLSHAAGNFLYNPFAYMYIEYYNI